MPTTTTLPLIPFAEIEARFRPVPVESATGVVPAMALRDGIYHLRVLLGDRFGYFRFAATGEVLVAPYGHAREFRPGRVEVAELDAAVARYAEAVRRG